MTTLSEPHLADVAPEASPPPAAESGAAANFAATGLAYLRGRGMPKDEGMAVASLLDAADLGHAPATLLCALCYFVGVGVTRNTQTAAEYAGKYMLLAPQAHDADVAREVIEGTLGTEHARRLLAGETRPGAASQPASARSRWPLVAGGAVAAAGLIGVLAFVLLRGTPDRPVAVSDDIADLIPAAELDAAKRSARGIASRLKAESTVAMKQADEEQARLAAQQAESEEQTRLAGEKAEQDAQQEREAQTAQLREAQAQASAAEARANAQAAELQAARQRASQAPGSRQTDQMSQLRTMYSAAVEALKQGEYDRANGLADAMLAIAPGNSQIQNLKTSIQQAKRDALSRMRAD